MNYLKSHKFQLILCTFIALAGCGKQGLEMRFKVIYTRQPVDLLKGSSSVHRKAGGCYTQFGDIVGTLTPTKVTASSLSFVLSTGKPMIR